MRRIIISDIVWDTDGEAVEELPKRVIINAENFVEKNDLKDIEERIGAYDQEIADYLSDEYGFLVESFLTDIDDAVEIDDPVYPEKYYAVTFQWAEHVYCENIAIGTKESVSREYSRYPWKLIREIKKDDRWRLEEARRKGMPFIKC